MVTKIVSKQLLSENVCVLNIYKNYGHLVIKLSKFPILDLILVSIIEGRKVSMLKMKTAIIVKKILIMKSNIYNDSL